MKKIIATLTFCLVVTFIFSQNKKVVIDSKEYQQLKQNNQLDQVELVNSVQPVSNNPSKIQAIERSGGACNCLMGVDSTFTLAMSPNDDGSLALSLPFIFCFYGLNYNSIWINNNGNITFDFAYGTYSAIAFPANSYSMIAPFWSDVDTRDSMGGDHGKVYYKITPSSLIVVWDSVGYFEYNGDKLNTFQLIITDGTDSLIPNGANISFCYGDMQWTTGDASSGINGFGGAAATVGANRGNGVDYFQIGRFNIQDTIFDGSYNNDDGIDFLDNKNIIMDACATNIPPIGLTDPCDTIILYVGQTIDLKSYFLAPEIGQTTSINASGPTGFNVVNNIPGSSAIMDWQFTGTMANVGFNTIIFTAADNGTPIGTTTENQVIEVINTTGINNLNETKGFIYPNPTAGALNIELMEPFINDITIAIYQSNGNLIYTREIGSFPVNNTISLDVSALSKGLYFVKINNGINSFTHKLVKTE